MRRTPRGFTLVEIMIAVAVLVIGLSAVVAMVLGSTRATVVAADRNTASIFLTEAAESIERLHLITPEVASKFNLPSNDVGLFIETATTVVRDPIAKTSWPSVYPAPSDPFDYSTLSVNGPYTLGQFVNKADPSKSTMVWPPSDESPRYNGPATAGGSGNAGFPYRVIYHLERHPDWVTHPNGSPYTGMYILTLAGYRDLNPRTSSGGVAGSDTAKKKYEQISDPMVVYLRARTKG